MAGAFRFTDDQYETENVLESSVFVDNEVPWTKNTNPNIILRYSNEGDVTLMETTSDTFFSADEEDNSQYFSILDTSNNKSVTAGELTPIENLAETEESPDSHAGDVVVEEEEAEPSGQQINDGEVLNVQVGGQPIIFRMEGSDEIYAIEVMCDEEGNLQKYQYRLRLDENGEYECIPDTVELLSDSDLHSEPPPLPPPTHTDEEEEETPVEPEAACTDSPVKQEQREVYIKMRDFSSDDDDEQAERGEDSPETILPTVIYSEPKNVKIEAADSKHLDMKQHSYLEPAHAHLTSQYNQFNLLLGDHCETDADAANFYPGDDHLNDLAVAQAQNLLPDSNVLEIIQEDVAPEEMEVDSLDGTTEIQPLTDDESDDEEEEEEQTLDEEHVTADVDVTTQPDSLLYQELTHFIARPHTQVLRIQQPNELVETRRLMPRMTTRTTRTYPYLLVANTEKENFRNISNSLMATTGGLTGGTKLVKTNPRSVLKTSVMPQQQLQPHIEMKRVEMERKPLLKNNVKGGSTLHSLNFHNLLTRTTIVQAPIRRERLPRKQKIKPVQRADEEIIVQEVIVSSNGYELPVFNFAHKMVGGNGARNGFLRDSDDEYSPRRQQRRRRSKKCKLMEIVISDSESDGEHQPEVVDLSQDSDDDDEKRGRARGVNGTSGGKRGRGRPRKNPEHEHIRTEWKCNKCPRTLPSEGSLKSHMACHNFPPPGEKLTKYECVTCQEVFRNHALLTKHTAAHNNGPKSLECPLCKRIFPDIGQIAAHKRKHVKKHLLRETTLLRASPKTPRRSIKFEENAAAITCRRCHLFFSNKLQYEDHLRNRCVKCVRASGRSSSPASKVTTKTKVETRLPCPSCGATFWTTTALLKHKLDEHARPAQRRSQATGKRMSQRLKEYGGVPLGTRYRSALASAKK